MPDKITLINGNKLCIKILINSRFLIIRLIDENINKNETKNFCEENGIDFWSYCVDIFSTSHYKF